MFAKIWFFFLKEAKKPLLMKFYNIGELWHGQTHGTDVGQVGRG